MNKPNFSDFLSTLNTDVYTSYFEKKNESGDVMPITTDKIASSTFVACQRMLEDYHEWLMKELDK